ncbi:tetratricopeptide repeat protein [Planctomicrobium sp. SH661]|uniref:tetratricopeptide repeat protein n=1 Tax=Planctomicrobium sp. SH661 TaxID=3448124 RepID=UPI003F5B7883
MTSLQSDRGVWISLFLFAVTGVLYLPTAWFDFVDFDDFVFVVDDPHVQEGLSPRGIWTSWSRAPEGNWTPLTFMSWKVDVSLWGMTPGPMHVVNLLLHAVNTVMVFWLLFLLTDRPWRSFAVALLFGVHPLHVESVAWISERRDVLFLFWTLIAFLCYRQYTQIHSKVWYAFTTLAFCLSLLSKSMAVTVPVLMLCLDYWPLQRWKSTSEDQSPLVFSKWKRLILEKAPWLALSLATGLVTVFAQKHVGAAFLHSSISPISRLANAIRAYSWYIEKTFWPVRLHILYEHPVNNWDAIAVGVSTTILLLVTLAVFCFRRQLPYLVTGWCWYVISLLPVIGLLQVGGQAYADRYTYLPQIGLGIMIVWGFSDWTARFRSARTMNAIAVTLAAVLFFMLAIQQVFTWKNGATLWQHALDIEPNVTTYNYKVGEHFLEAKEFDAAEQRFLKAIETLPKSIFSWLKLGATYDHQGRREKAIETYEHLVSFDPQNFLAWKNLGRVYQQQGELMKAKEALNRALQINRTDPDVFNRLGFLYGNEGDLEAATKLFEEAVKVAPQDALSRINLGMALNAQGKPEQAVTHLQKGVSIDPKNAAAYLHLGAALESLNRIPEAIMAYSEAIRLNPEDAQSRSRLESLRPVR